MNRKKSIQTTLDNFIRKRTPKREMKQPNEETFVIIKRKSENNCIGYNREERNEYLQYLKNKIEQYELINKNKMSKWEEELKFLEEKIISTHTNSKIQWNSI